MAHGVHLLTGKLLRVDRPAFRRKDTQCVDPSMLADLKYAMREFRRSPGFALTAVLTFALGIGATTAIFTLVHAVLLRSLPVEDPAALWRVGDNEQCCQNGGLPTTRTP